ncbi:MAG: Hsp33 family molecular chaperone HslO, partial [Pseudomonadales bacterium]
MSDQGQRFLFDEFAIRGELVQLSDTTREIFNNHEYPESVKNLIGEFVAAAALLSATIKFEGSLILQVKGEGQVSMLMAECRNRKALRALARYNENFDSALPLLGKGQMAIIIEPDEGERY